MNNTNLQISSSMENFTKKTGLEESKNEPLPNFTINPSYTINKNNLKTENQENVHKFSNSTSNKISSSNISLYKNLLDDTKTQNSEISLTKASTSASQIHQHNNLINESNSNQNNINSSFLQFISSQIQYYQNEIL